MSEPTTLADEEDFDDEDLEGLEEGEDYNSNSTHRPLDKEAKQRLAFEYKDVVMQIDAQNKIVDSLKIKLCEKSIKPCRTRCEDREIRSIRCCLERENLKLQCLMKRAMSLQEEDPNRIWEAIPLATTYEEDSMPMSLNYKPSPSAAPICDDGNGLGGGAGRCSKRPLPNLDNNNDNLTRRDLMKLVSSLMKQAKKQSRHPKISCGSDDLDEGTLRRVACALQNTVSQDTAQRSISCCKKSSGSYQKVCKELHRSYSMQERLANDNAGLEGERYRLQEEILCRDKMIDELQQKINCMQNEVQQLCRDRQKALMMQESGSGGGHKSTTHRNNSNNGCRGSNNCCKPKSVQHLESNIDAMESSMDRLKAEMECLRKERDRWECTLNLAENNSSGGGICDDKQQLTADDICCKRNNRNRGAETEELRNKYANLLSEYAKKESELKDYKGRTQAFCNNKMGNNNNNGNEVNVDYCELELLREKVTDMREEQEEFKCLIKEQAEQLVEYQNKYLAAQQKVEEQKSILDKLEMNNKRIEDQINLEIQRIKEKFQEKLKELAQLPKLLENEQLKLAAACKEKEDLEYKLRLVCKELKAVKALHENVDKSPDCSQKLSAAENDLLMMEKELHDMKRDKDLLCDQIQKMKDDLDTLRSESARIIARTKERSEQTRQALQERIDAVEKDLAQCRATACLSIADREEVIKEMQCQLNTIAYSFDSAQNQIKTLKTHIAYLSHDDCMPVKC